MIYVPRERLQEVEYLIGQSIQGHHLLFDADWLRTALVGADAPFREEEGYAVEPHIERLIELGSFREKRAYLERMDPHTLRQVIRTYFHIVENNLFEASKTPH